MRSRPLTPEEHRKQAGVAYSLAATSAVSAGLFGFLLLRATGPWWPLRCLSFLHVGLAVANLVRARQHATQAVRIRDGLCLACGYDLRESAGRCSECGEAVREAAA